MPKSSAAPAGWSPRHGSPPGWSPANSSSLGWLILIPLGCVLLGQVLLAWTGIVPVLDGVLADPDAYMRLNRVLELHEGGAWFDSRYPRIGPPEGHVQHWTRPLDLLLLIGAWLLQPAFGFEQALHLFGVLFSPICLVLMVVALAWAAQPILDRDARMLACLALLWQPMVLAYSSLGRPDHHALLLLLFVLLLGLTFRLLADPYARRLAELAGLVAALAIWVSPEALVFIAPSLVALGWAWLLGEAGMAAAI
jgi:asparagine N-glycosylation enzyme membrane subunit Stt3